MTSPQAREPINGNLREGQEHGVQSTPTVFINGRTVLGAAPYAHFEQIIEEELARLRPHPGPTTDKGAVASVRDWLRQNGVGP